MIMRHQALFNRTRQLPHAPLRPIPPRCRTKLSAHDDCDLRVLGAGRGNDHIETARRHTATTTLRTIDILSAPKEQRGIRPAPCHSLAPRLHRRIDRQRSLHPHGACRRKAQPILGNSPPPQAVGCSRPKLPNLRSEMMVRLRGESHPDQDALEAQTLSRARPLARRRASTLRPPLVLMRFRNPCSRLRFRLDGC